MRATVKRWAPELAAIASGGLLYASFAPLAAAEAAWISLVPLLLACRSARSARDSFRLGFLAGCVFWLASIVWLTHVTFPGWLALSCYCALYVGGFSVVAHLWLGRFGADRFLPNLGFMALLAAAWAGLEWIRSIFASGFPWNPLGASQVQNAALLQSAAWGGVYAVSALVTWVNAGVAVTVLRYVERRGRWGRRPHPEIFLAFLVVALLFMLGVRHLRATGPGDTRLRVALIQTNIPQDEKWDQEKVALIYARLEELTLAALRSGPLDLIIWPETALPDDVRSSPASYDLVYRLCTNGVPILVGSMDTEWPDEGAPIYYNSSFLFDAEGTLTGAYDKRHLVPFGEYVPFRRAVPFIKALTPIQESFSGGSTSTVFELASPPVAFSVLICFEDTVAHLARSSVRNGARLLINQTNDAWFDPSAASRQHMAQCVLRCVENGVPAVRVANTGVSCYIDRRGAVRSVLEDEHAGTLFAGFKTVEVWVPMNGFVPTFYARHGDVFAGAAGLLALLATWWVMRGKHDKPNQLGDD